MWNGVGMKFEIQPEDGESWNLKQGVSFVLFIPMGLDQTTYGCTIEYDTHCWGGNLLPNIPSLFKCNGFNFPVGCWSDLYC